ncbi:amino acid adenylation domain-containing protein [Nostoc sp. UCD121]|uniref:non-ribosomal peptide synthetase n=1 Tax=unclassified Nostoc TaxID=2593658 RepID=UPI0016296EC9|nr:MULTISPECIES: non-ribosomal peptide synthetase [unclassified Nostoc]MBC1221787.1 amino acid adenylation domain-containing protein [Nostoc sp. UCD120]MBC1274874.1 amino acid adenylation domain-containing protein [Nostoc sp. UCD121]MBC1293584.1 amino acid adenylation domain-containing protein [Nostoc sp. UCD122]
MKAENIEDIYKLSPTQQGLLFHTLYAPDSGVYCDQYSITLKGNLNTLAFEQAWQQLAKRHAVLRTSFHWEELDEPMQVVHRQVKLPLEQQDWRGINSGQQQQRLESFLKTEQKRGFELSHPPLMRLVLIQLTDDVYQFIWSNHHILWDGWSRVVLFKEFLEIYQALCTNQNPYLKPAFPYRKYITWLRQQDLSQAEAFWRNALKGFTAPTPLVVDKFVANTSSHQEYDEQKIELSVATTEKLKSFARQYQITVNTLVQGAWALLLSRYSGEDDVVFGANTSGRPVTLPGVESAVGLFVNTLPVRVRVNGNDAIISWLKTLQTEQAQARQYEYSPLVQIQGWSEISKGVPLFQSFIAFENYPVDSSLLQGKENLEIDGFSAVNRSNYPLSLIVAPLVQLQLQINSDRHCFDVATITRMLGHLQTVLEGMAANPERQLKDVPLLTETEQHQCLVEWNNTQIEYPVNLCIHQLFEAHVEKTPDAIALTFADQHLTYHELNCRANQLAHHLQKLGVGSEVQVGICVERSLEMVIGLLAILKAGGAYVPIDPSYPQSRQGFILKDAQIRVLLTQQDVITKLPEHQAQVICLDSDWITISQESTKNPDNSNLTPENLAYIIYTSGSTGQPKGVLIPHANVVRLLRATQSWFHFNKHDVWTLFHSFAFDFSVWELWGALCYGGRVVVVSYLVSRTPQAFCDLLCQERVTILNQTPSAFRQLMQQEQLSGKTFADNLRLVIFGGEALDIQSLAPWFERHGEHSPQLVNMYGITETTVHVTYRPLTLADLRTASASVIGRPIPDLQVYVLDKHNSLLPIGIPGEMCVGGAGLARGYLNRPELTSQKFIPNPYSNKPSDRLYKSGDLARYLPNGELEYLGRIDHQVKIRGFRIELGEIEALLRQHTDVRETVVLLREDQLGNKQLVAYIVANSEQFPTTSELRNWLKVQLPDYMVPSGFVLLEALPLTSNGKVDRQALPTPNTARPELDEAYMAPSTLEEKALVDIWVQVLDVEQVGIHDNFFALGGDSIRSIQVLSKAKERGLSLSLQQIFQHQTIHQLAQELTTAKANIAVIEQVQPFNLICEEDLCKLPNDVEDAYPLTMLQAGMLFHSQYSVNTKAYHNVSSIHLKAPFDFEKLHTAIQQLANRHPVLRTSFDLSNFSEPLQLIHKTVSVPCQLEDLRHLSATEQEETLTASFEAEKTNKFDCTIAPLLRFQIHRRSEDTFQFSFTEHHAILDGWSVASMLTELFEHYFFLLGKKVSPIQPPPANAFRNFVALQKQALQSEECQRYWMQKFNDSPTTTIPRRPVSQRSADKTSEVRVVQVPINSDISERLKKLAQSNKVPLKSVLFAAHLRVINKLCRESEVVTLVSSNGRPETTDGTRCLGLFLNPLPFRMKLPQGNWTDLITQVFQTEQELLPFRWYPMAQIQKDLGGQRRFETCFNFTHFHVYQRIETLTDLEVLDTKGFNITDFVVLAEFRLNVISSQIELSLCCNTAELCNQQIEEISNEYAQTITAIAQLPDEEYEIFYGGNNQEFINERQVKEIDKSSIQKLKLAKRKTLHGL